MDKRNDVTLREQRKDEWKSEGKEYVSWLDRLEKVLINVLRPELNSKKRPPCDRNTRVCDIPLPACGLVGRD